MTYRPVVDQFIIPVALDPLSAALFTALFAGAALLTARRAAYGLCMLILSAPTALYRDVLGTTLTIPKVVLLGVLVGLTAYAGNAKRLRERPVPLLAGALAFYLAASMLTLLDAAHRGATIREAFKVAEYGALFVAAFLCYRIDPDDAPLVTAWSVAAIAVALSALAQEIVGAPSGLYIGSAIVPRIAGILEGPNQLSAYCEIVIAVLGAWALVRRTSLLDTALLLAVFADVLTFSRAGLLGVGVVGIVFAFVAGRSIWPALRPALLGLGAGLIGAAWWAVYAHTPAVLRASLQPSLYAGGVGNRGELWHAAWRMWLRRPILGVGAGNFELELPEYGVYGVRTHANSWFLQSLAEGGLVLFSATLALIGTLVATFSYGGVVARLRTGSPWILAALAATLALALHQIVDYLVFYPKVGGPWWLLIGVAAAALARRP